MIIRKWEKPDNLAVSNLEKICFSYPWTYEMVSETANSNNFCGVVCESEGEVVGYAGAIFAYDTADIALVAVNPTHRRKGYAQELLNTLLKMLVDKQVTNIFLEVRKSNFSAQNLYLKCGFIPVGERKNYYEDSEDAILMFKGFTID